MIKFRNSAVRVFRKVSVAAWVMYAPLALAQVDENSGKSMGQMIVLPGMTVAKGVMAMHLPGNEYAAGIGWWALACPARCELFALRLTVTPKLHPAYDSEPVPGQMLLFLPVPPVTNVLLSFKPSRLNTQLKLHAGPVTTYYPGILPHLRRPNSAGTMESEIGLPEGRTARLVPTLLLPPPRTEGNSKKAQRGESETGGILQLELHMDGRYQALGVFNFGIEGAMALKPSDYVIWSGDLDGDGKPDFLLNFDFHGTDLALFLSSLARNGEIVGEAGRFKYFPIDSAGC